jgi:twinkle protein
MTDYREEMSRLGMGAITTSGKYLCPRCSSSRKNKHDRCLSVTFEAEGVAYKCHNSGCDFEGFISYDNRYKPNVKRTFIRPQRHQEDDDRSRLEKYFAARGISANTLKVYQVASHGKFIIFNYFKNGELVNVKTRENLPEGKKTFYQEKDSEKTFYGMDVVPADVKRLIICEGEIDVLSFYEVGLYAVSVPQGAGEKKLECIDNCWDFLQRFDEYILAGDSDEAGLVLRGNLINRLGKEKCRIADWGKYEVKGKDANDFLQKEPSVIRDCIDTAEFVPLAGIATFSGARDKIADYYLHGYKKGASTGWSNLDNIFTIKPGFMMIVTGIPTRGKSFFVDNLLVNLTQNEGWRHLIVSFENTLENHFSRFYSMYTHKGFSRNQSTLEEVMNGVDLLSGYFYRLEVNRGWNVDEIISQAEYAVRRYGIKTLTIDPYNRLDRDFTDREDLFIGEILKKLSLAAKRLDIFIIFVAHPKKMNKEDGAPDMYAISGSADWYNMADYGITIHRERLANTKQLSEDTKVIVHKVKDFTLGNPAGGECVLSYNRSRFVLEEKSAVTQRYWGTK